jgi:gamma-butyrobetaine dioxygenase
VLLSYQRPHLALDAAGHVTALFWSPPFEGPLRVPLGDVRPYYEAYAALQRCIERAPRWQQRLDPGDLLVFSNRRMLHGREAFAPSRDGGGSRWLQGCYISIDDFANRHNLLRRCFHDDERHGERPTPRHLGNQDWAHRPGSAWLPAS